MDLGWLWLILGSFFTLYSFYAWRKNADNQWKQLGILGIAIVLLLTARLVLINQFSENIRETLSVIVWAAWIPALIALVCLGIAAPPKKNRLLKNRRAAAG